jgi:sugar phosphate isomerase/epimerase
MQANPLNLPIGLQLYTVGAEMDRDPFGTLKRIAAIGYKEVELSPLSKTPAKDLAKALHDNGLLNPSGHFMLPDLLTNLQKNIDAAKQFGQDYMVVTVPWVADPTRFGSSSGGDQMAFFSLWPMA